jgi:hypothetical protein
VPGAAGRLGLVRAAAVLHRGIDQPAEQHDAAAAEAGDRLRHAGLSAGETRSYRPGGWRTDNDDVYQGEYFGNGNHTGCAFYGSRPRSLSGATVNAATIKVMRPSRGGGASAQGTTLRLVTQSVRPAGAPTLGSSTTGPSLKWGGQATFTIPDAWGQAIVDGTSGGIAVFDSSGSPYVILSGRSEWSPSFTLTIDWQR